MKSKVEKEYPYGLKQYNKKQIEQLGLRIIASIRRSVIEYDTDEMNTLFQTVNHECKNCHIWFLFGSNDGDTWIPLQAASCTAKTVISKIKEDFLCMTSYDEQKDKKPWSSYFYQSVMEIEYGRDPKCQKYHNIRKMCEFLAIAIIEDEQLKENEPAKEISIYQKTECDIAYELKPLIWNPAGKEHNYLQSKKPLDSSQ